MSVADLKRLLHFLRIFTYHSPPHPVEVWSVSSSVNTLYHLLPRCIILARIYQICSKQTNIVPLEYLLHLSCMIIPFLPFISTANFSSTIRLNSNMVSVKVLWDVLSQLITSQKLLSFILWIGVLCNHTNFIHVCKARSCGFARHSASCSLCCLASFPSLRPASSCAARTKLCR